MTIKKTCCCCNNHYELTNFHKSPSKFFNGYLPICCDCLEKKFKEYCDEYQKIDSNYEVKAIQRVCMAFDIFYSDKLFEAAKKRQISKSHDKFIVAYLKSTDLRQYKDKTYDNTLIGVSKNQNKKLTIDSNNVISQSTVERFGYGFPDEDYRFLQKEYDDWTTRHECNTKSQEEVFKNLCFDQLALYKARINGGETKDLQATFNKDLEAANLQPKQNAKETVSDTQTFGTLIDKWENTKPLPEIDEELKDVDKIGLLISVFFTGHISKVLKLKSSLITLYNKWIGKYTVKKPEYDTDDEDAIFDSIFGDKEI